MLTLLKNKKGVTLVELLAVIIILGIIAAIAVPTIGNLIENQKVKAAQTEWANIQDAARLYATDKTSGNITLADLETYLSNTPALVAYDGDNAVVTNLFSIGASGQVTINPVIARLNFDGPDPDGINLTPAGVLIP